MIGSIDKISVLLMLVMTVTHSYANDSVIRSREPITPVPEVTGLNPDKVILGRRLFHDAMLSSDGTISCASCHNLNNAGIDGLTISIGIRSQQGTRNTPTVLNAALLFRQFWDGRAASLEKQALEPFNNPKEMDNNFPAIIHYLESNQTYKKTFKAIYQQSPSKYNITDAIAEFERSLLTPNGAFDRYLKGDDTAINTSAKRGYTYFKNYGCVSCHQGVAVGGNLYEKLGIIKPYPHHKNQNNTDDFGRYNLTGIEEQKFEFKVPGLRNVARTAPYLHNGSVATLEAVIKIMAEYQLGRTLPDDHISDIIHFLETLNAETYEK